jgi:hypothetical protein
VLLAPADKALRGAGRALTQGMTCMDSGSKPWRIAFPQRPALHEMNKWNCNRAQAPIYDNVIYHI